MIYQVCCVYAGFDPTANSLHIGNLLILLGLLHCQRAGHRVVALLGGATARIGDPSGRSTEREEITQEQLEENSTGIKNDIEKIFKNHKKYFWDESSRGALHEAEIVNNESWYKTMNIIDFLGKVSTEGYLTFFYNLHIIGWS
jgi:tyrosyl-tRNA synthetase